MTTTASFNAGGPRQARSQSQGYADQYGFEGGKTGVAKGAVQLEKGQLGQPFMVRIERTRVGV
jgi:hypothetical protein